MDEGRGDHRCARASCARGDRFDTPASTTPTATWSATPASSSRRCIAVEAVDLCSAGSLELVAKLDGALVVTADHGNADEMFERRQEDRRHPRAASTGSRARKTSHTLNPVPLYVYAPIGRRAVARRAGRAPGIANVAATVLTLLGYTPPDGYEPSLLTTHATGDVR